MRHESQLSVAPLVVVELYRLGDCVYSWSLAAALAKRFPERTVSILCSEVAAALPINKISKIPLKSIPAPWLNKGWIWKPAAIAKAVKASSDIIRNIGDNAIYVCPRVGFIERIILPRGKFRDCIRIDTREVSFRGKWMDLSATHPFAVREQLLRAVGLKMDADSSDWHLTWPFLKDIFCQGRVDPDLVLLCPEAGNQAREWPIERWRELALSLVRIGKKVVFVTTKNLILRELKGHGQCTWRGTIEELGVLIGRASAVVAVDSFVGHYASAIGVPVLTLFGPQDPIIWKPHGKYNEYIQAQEASRWQYDNRQTIEAIGPQLMNALSVEAVWAKCESWLAKI
jgi:ADP-heptose:LPS heptosyltransferase